MRSVLISIFFHFGVGCVVFFLLEHQTLKEEVPVEIVEFQRLREATRPEESRARPITPKQKPISPASSSVSTQGSGPSSASSALLPGFDTKVEGIAEEYEVGELPVLINEVRIPYPTAAKSRRIQGAVVFDLIIGADGSVRVAKPIQSPDPVLTEAAQAAVKKFKFKPARIGDKPVAIQIRYTYRFVLE
jgi:TonB family protein